MPQRPFYALFIGINQYKSDTVPDLRGCVHDVKAMHELLQTRFGAAAENMTTLLDAEATHHAIRTAFQLRLLAPLQAWAASGQSGEKPAILFYFSGHGSQARTANKPSGFDETIIPHDSRTPGIYDIKDWELGGWLTELAPYTDNVTVILDCCHSGSGTRGDQKAMTNIRGCAPDERPQPAPDGTMSAVRVMRGAIDLSQQPRALGHVLLAACRNDEKAREDALGDPPQAQGVLSFWLQQTLRAMDPQQPLRYRELYDQLHHRVNSAYRDQTPQCEGDRDRLFLGGIRAEQARWLTVTAANDGMLWIDSGQAHGLRVGSILHVYPPDVALATNPTQPPLAMLEVATVEAARSGCRRAATDPGVAIPPGARALVHRAGQGSQRTKLALAVAEGWFLKAIRERLLHEDIRPQIELALPGERATLRLALVGETLQLQDGSGQQIYQSYNLRDLNRYRRPFQASDLEPVVRDLFHRLNQTQVQGIASEAGSEIALAIEVKLERLIMSPNDQALQTAPLTTDSAGNVVIPIDQPFVLNITNRDPRPLYFTLLELGYDGDVNRLYPQIAGANVAVASQQTVTLGRTTDPNQQFVMRLPAGIAHAEEILKVFATTQEANFDHLLQGKTPTRTEPTPVMRGGQPRNIAPSEPVTRSYQLGGDRLSTDQWGTVEVRVKVVRAVNGF